MLSLLVAACNKMDDNGPFEGQWVLTSVEGSAEFADASVLPPLVWGVRNELIQMSHRASSNFLYARFERNDARLVLTEIYENDGSNDVRVTDYAAIPAGFLVPDDGKYQIIRLDDHRMQLKAGELVLDFKKN